MTKNRYNILHLPTGTLIANDLDKTNNFSERFFCEAEIEYHGILCQSIYKPYYNLQFEFTNKKILSYLRFLIKESIKEGNQFFDVGISNPRPEHFELVKIEDK